MRPQILYWGFFILMDLITEQQYNEALAIVKAYKKQPCEHWKVIVDCWFVWYAKQRNGEEPDFTGSAPKDLREIAKKIKRKCENYSLEWSEDVAKRSVTQFFDLCLKYPFTSDKFMLSLFNKYFQEITTLYGKATTNKSRPEVNIQSAFAKIDGMFSR